MSEPVVQRRWGVLCAALMMVVDFATASEATWDLGAVPVGSWTEHQLTLPPVREARVVRDVVTSCACVQVLERPSRIEPGAGGRIRLRYLASRPGRVGVDVRVVTDQGEWEHAIVGTVQGERPDAELEAWLAAFPPGSVTRRPALGDAIARVQPDAVEPDAVWIDVREAEAYVAGHIPGAVSLDGRAMMAQSRRWSERPVVIYDSGFDRSQHAAGWAARLKREGVDNVAVLDGGWAGWTRGGREVEGTDRAGAQRVAVSAADFMMASLREDVTVIDVSAAGSRWGAFVWPGARNVPYEMESAFQAAVATELRERPATEVIVVDAGDGFLAKRAAAALDARSERVFWVEGGGAACQTFAAAQGWAGSQTVTFRSGGGMAGASVAQGSGAGECGTCPH